MELKIQIFLTLFSWLLMDWHIIRVAKTEGLAKNAIFKQMVYLAFAEGSFLVVVWSA